jgi:hypothetical protein
MKTSHLRWTLLIAANALAWCVLSLHGTTGAAPQPPQQPFNNAVEQRQEMIRELSEIRALLKEQNTLMRAGASKTPTNDQRQR